MKNIQEIAPGLDNAGDPLAEVATGGQPKEEHLQRLAEAGYRTVVDLRTLGESPHPDEWGMIVRSAGLEYVNIPVGHEDIDDETFDRFRELMRDCGTPPRAGALF